MDKNRCLSSFRLLPGILRGAVVVIGAVLCLGCTKQGPTADKTDFLRFETDGSAFELRHIVLTQIPLGGDGRTFVTLGFDPAQVKVATAAPAATIQWKMEQGGVDGLEGRTIDLSEERYSAVVQFIFDDPETGLVHETPTPSFRITVSDLTTDFIEGSFQGEGFTRVVRGDAAKKGVSVSGAFRARLEAISR